MFSASKRGCIRVRYYGETTMPRNAITWVVTAAAFGMFCLIGVDGAGAQVIEENGAEEVIQPMPEQQWECGVIDGSAEALGGVAAVAGGGCPTAWPGGVIPFTISTGGLNPGYIRQAMDVWNQADAGIVFIPRTDEPNFVRFVSNSALSGGRSFVGMIGGSQDFEVHDLMWVLQPLVLHEMGHLLGQWHEHQRPDRDSFVRINRENINPGQGGDIVPINSCWLTLATGYDFLSIVHYRTCQRSICSFPCPLNPTCSGLVDWGRTIVALPAYAGFDLVMGNVLLPSAVDVDDMRNIYGRGVATYVDRFGNFLGNGTLGWEFPYFSSGVEAVHPGSTLAVREGTYTSPGVIDKPMTIRSYLGSVTLTR